MMSHHITYIYIYISNGRNKSFHLNRNKSNNFKWDYFSFYDFFKNKMLFKEKINNILKQFSKSKSIWILSNVSYFSKKVMQIN